MNPSISVISYTKSSRYINFNENLFHSNSNSNSNANPNINNRLDGVRAVPAFSYISTNSEFSPMVTDLRQLLKHSPTVIDQEMTVGRIQEIQSIKENNIVKEPKVSQNKKDKKKDKDKKNKNKKEKNENLNNSPKKNQNGGGQLVAMKRNVPPHHEYYNIIDEEKKNNNNNKNLDRQAQFRKFGDTNLMAKNKKNLHMNNPDIRIHNGVYRNGTSTITSFAYSDASKYIESLADSGFIDQGYPNFNNSSKFLNIDFKTPKRKLSISPNSTANSSDLNSINRWTLLSRRLLVKRCKISRDNHLWDHSTFDSYYDLHKDQQNHFENVKKGKVQSSKI